MRYRSTCIPPISTLHHALPPYHITGKLVSGALGSGAMESLLSVAFDNISSRDSTKIWKGLRQIEGLLAQLCLAKNARRQHKRSASVLEDSKEGSSPKQLRDLKSDPAFREFFRLQDGFQCNGMRTTHISARIAADKQNSRIPPHINPRAPSRPPQLLAKRPNNPLSPRPPPRRLIAPPAFTHNVQPRNVHEPAPRSFGLLQSTEDTITSAISIGDSTPRLPTEYSHFRGHGRLAHSDLALQEQKYCEGCQDAYTRILILLSHA